MWKKEEDQSSYYHLTASSLFNRRGEIEGWQIVISDVTERCLPQEELERRAYIDGLTNIFNRSSFIERTQMILEEDAQDTAILLFDIDFFKQINDTHGHHIGDEAPRHVVTICQRIYRWTIYSDDMAEKSLLFVCRTIHLKRHVILRSE